MLANTDRKSETTFSSDPILYVGTYSVRSSKGVYSFHLNPASGELRPLKTTETACHPSALAAIPSRDLLYVASETSDDKAGGTGSIAAYRFNRTNGDLQFLNRVQSGGASPCHLSVDESGTHVMVANFGGGTVALLPLAGDGSLNEPGIIFDCRTLSEHRQVISHPHFIATVPNGLYIVVADLGMNRLIIFSADRVSRSLFSNRYSSVLLPEGSGPRHCCFHPNGRWLYVLNELSSEIAIYSWDPAGGSPRRLQVLSSLPPGYTGRNYAAELHLDTAGEYLYASNRGHDSIAIFRIDKQQEKLTPVRWTHCGGRTPRSFALYPGGTYLVVGNEGTDDLAVFSISHRDEGPYLTLAGRLASLPSPACLAFV